MATTLNAGTTTGTSLAITPDTTGAMVIQTSGSNAISISSSQVVTFTNPLPAGSGGTGVSSLGAGVATFLSTPSSTNLAAAVTDETGSGALVFATSPTLAGTPLAPTASTGTSTTQIATTAFVQATIPTGVIVMWSGSVASIPSGWLLCNGSSGTPDLRNRFIVGAGSTYSVAATGGSTDAVVVSHSHSANSTVFDPGHSHSNNTTVGTDGAGSALRVSNPASDEFPTTRITTNSAGTGISVTTSVSTTGSSGVNANLPPYYALAYIMKA